MVGSHPRIAGGEVMNAAEYQRQNDLGVLRSYAAKCEADGHHNDAASLRRIAAALNQQAGVVEALPELPEPVDYRALNAWGPKPDYYTAEQMQAYARAALAAIKEKDRG
jgi:hypothetical protein